MSKKINVIIQGHMNVRVYYSETVEVEVTDDMSEEDILEEARNENDLAPSIAHILMRLDDEHPNIDEVKIKDGDEDAYIDNLDAEDEE